jgi:hypothetical protein
MQLSAVGAVSAGGVGRVPSQEYWRLPIVEFELPAFKQQNLTPEAETGRGTLPVHFANGNAEARAGQ